jgi:hypothetical protein
MARSLTRRESKILMYFIIVTEGCRKYIKSCEYTPYYCGYSEPRNEPVTVYELCLFAAGVIKCPGEVEKCCIEKHNKSTYRANLRAVESLEKKRYIEKEPDSGSSGKMHNRWLMKYKLLSDCY